MTKIRNKLYPDPSKAKAWPAGTDIQISQAIRVGAKKFTTNAIYFPQGMYLKIAVASAESANKNLAILMKKVNSEKEMVNLDGDEYDIFLATAISTVIWSYAAIEAFANNMIDIKAPEKKKNRYLKMNLADKLKVILPKITGKNRLSDSLWDNFHLMDELRHLIIHTKRDKYWIDVDSWSTTIPSRLFNGAYKNCPQTADKIMGHFKTKTGETGPVTYHNLQRGLSEKPPAEPKPEGRPKQ